MEKGYQLQQWEFVDRLGAGGMAEVWKARHVHMDEYAAVKFLLPEYASNAEVQARFLREGRSQFRLRHPNIVKTSDFITIDNRHFLVMDYVEGVSLEDVVLDQGALPIDRALELALPILDALGHAHEHDIVHRDVKLSNILLDKSGKPYLTDFGIAKARDGAGARNKTATSMVMGSVHYMSPEQIQRPSEVDHRSDIYSFGCVLYEMLVGQPPFDSAETGGETDFEIQRQHVFEAPRPLREVNPAIPARLEAVVLCALEKDKNNRFASCKAMARALRESMAVEPPVDRPILVDPPFSHQPEAPATAEPLVPEASTSQIGKASSSGIRKKTQLEGTPLVTEQPAERHRSGTVFGTGGHTAQPVPVPGPIKKPQRWLTAVVLFLVVGVLGFAGYKIYENYRPDKVADKQDTPTPVPPDDPGESEAARLRREQEAAALAQQQQEDLARQKREAELALQQKDAELAAERQKNADLAAQRQREADLAAQRQRDADAAERQRQADLAAQQQRDADLRQREADLAAQQRQAIEEQRRRDLAAQKAATKTAPPVNVPQNVPPRGSFHWQLDLRAGQTALIRFRPDGSLEYLSEGRFLGGSPLYGVSADVRLSPDALKMFEVSQPLMPSTGFRQLELKCKKGRCNETVEVIWTRN